MRLFLAINLEPALREAIVDATAPLRDVAPDVAWVREPQIHLTLKFLGEQPPERVDEIATAMRAVAIRHRTMELELGGIGAFPAFRRARVIWMGIEPEPRLELLHHDVEVACEGLGFELDGRAYRPHLTLGRVKGRPTEDEMRALARAAKRVNFRGASSVETVDLMASELAPGGSRYTRLDAAPLRTD